MKSILITTKHRGVFFGQVPADKDLTPTTLTDIENARMAISFGTTRGVLQLAETGPTENSRIGAACKVNVLHDVTGVFECSVEATEKWMSA